MLHDSCMHTLHDSCMCVLQDLWIRVYCRIREYVCCTTRAKFAQYDSSYGTTFARVVYKLSITRTCTIVLTDPYVYALHDSCLVRTARLVSYGTTLARVVHTNLARVAHEHVWIARLVLISHDTTRAIHTWAASQTGTYLFHRSCQGTFTWVLPYATSNDSCNDYTLALEVHCLLKKKYICWFKETKTPIHMNYSKE